MNNSAIFAMTFAAAIGSAVVAGIFYGFSTFIMAALGRIPPEQGISAMQSINITVLNPAFFLAFFGTAALCLALIVAAWASTRAKPVASTLLFTALAMAASGAAAILVARRPAVAAS